MNKNGDQDNSNEQKSYWRSFAEYFNDSATKDQMKPEFLPGAAEDLDISKMNGVTRRHFLALLGTSAALAGAGCSDYYDQGEIVPYNKKPIDTVPGVANFFASTMVDQGEAYGVLIKSREGRPIKIDGNPTHPINKGKLNSRLQASIMELYAPDRLNGPLAKSPIQWEAADEQLSNGIKSVLAEKKSVAIVTHSVVSPSFNQVLGGLEQKGFVVYSYELNGSQLRDQVWAQNFGGGKYPVVDWSQPKVILALESDFLGAEAGATEAIGGFTANRSALFENRASKFNKLYVAEGQLSVTGINADYRMRVNPAQLVDFVLNLIVKLKDSFAFDADVLTLASKAAKMEIPENLVRDLIANKGATFLYAGEKVSSQVHTLVNYVNEVMGSQAYSKTESRANLRNLNSLNDFSALAADINGGKVGAVIHVNCNPVYHLPKDSGYVEALKKAKLVVTLSEFKNETTAVSNLVLPVHHSLESWGDYWTRNSVYSLQQPVLSPLRNSRQAEGILLSLLTGEAYQEKAYREFVKEYAKKEVFEKQGVAVGFDVFWKAALQNGFVKVKPVAVESKKFSADSLKAVQVSGAISGITVMLSSSPTGDGRLIGNGWVQEVPHPVSKVVWDNYAAMSIDTAKKLNVRPYVTPYDKNYDVVSIEVGGRKVEAPALMLPGMADDLVVIESGFGRKEAGVIGMGESGNGIGVNSVELMSVKGGVSPWLYTGGKVNKTEDKYLLVSTQEFHSLEGEISGEGAVGTLLGNLGLGSDKFLADQVSHVAEDRNVAKEGTVEHGLHYHKHQVFSINDMHEYPGYKWAMAIDMNKCTGCNDCIVSCNAENNIPVVGKTQVNKGREMHWMRIDRYFKGSTRDVKASFQPMLCQHCDHAPCENVCPVVATAHSPDGLNDMAYNRCVGTRYCANNCPYKVRRFNFYNFRNSVGRTGNEWTGKGYYEDPSFNLIHNPEVTVRSRGVMEKCSFCVQRIFEARQKAKEQGRVVRDGDVVTACQSACPSNAIMFGNINDAKSKIRKWANSDVNYKVLEELNVRPNVNYLAKLRFADSIAKADAGKEAAGESHGGKH